MFFIFAFYPFITIRFNITAVSLALFTRCRFYMRLNNEILMKFIFLSFCKDTYIIKPCYTFLYCHKYVLMRLRRACRRLCAGERLWPKPDCGQI